MTRWISNRGWGWAGAGLCVCLLLGQPSAASARDDDDELSDLDDDDDDDRDAEEASEDSSDGDAEGSDPEAQEQEPEAAPEPQQAEPSGPSVLIQPYAGAGITTRSVRMPDATGGELRVMPGVAPAAEVGLRVVAWPSADFSLVVALAYQSALFYAITEHPPLALDKEVRARSERVALDLAPTWLLGPIRVGVPFGVTIRTLWPEVHTSQTPGYSLVGPHVALDLSFPLAETITLRLRPELHYIMLIDQQLRGVGVSSEGVALGGDAGVDVRLSQAWAIGVNYRESHALISTNRPDITFHDAERYVTVRATGSF